MSMTEQGERQVARPLKILVPLIKKDFENAEKAGVEHYRAAGEKLIEAKAQLKHGEFGPWIKRNFNRSVSQARLYIQLADATGSKQNAATRSFSSLGHFKREHLGDDRPYPVHPKPWHQDVKDTIERARRDMERIREESLTRQQERTAEQQLALRLIDIGYKVLAKELHPDRGGSRDAMQRLTRVRDRLKQHA